MSGDGVLDLDELGSMTGFAQLARRLMGRADADRSGQLTMEEWVALPLTLTLPLTLPLPLTRSAQHGGVGRIHRVQGRAGAHVRGEG